MNKDVIKKYKNHKYRAYSRKIPWKFTLDEWWSVWEISGKWEERGCGGYVMARFGDEGPYSKKNVKIITSAENVKEGFIFKGYVDLTERIHIKCKPAEKKAWIKKAEGRDTYLSDWMRWLANKAK